MMKINPLRGEKNESESISLNEEEQAIHESSTLTDPITKPSESYGATQYQYSSSALINNNNNEDRISSIQSLIRKDTWPRQSSVNTRPHIRHDPSSIQSRHGNTTNRRNRSPFIQWLFKFIYHLHSWIRDTLFILGSITEDEDYYDDGGNNSEAESSHDRMTTTIASVSRHVEPIRSSHHQQQRSSQQSPILATASTTDNKQYIQKYNVQDETDHSSTYLTTDRSTHHRSNSPTQVLRRLKHKHGKKRIGRFVWLILLATVYSIERCTFKILLDRMGPFRLVVGTQGIMTLHILLLGLSMIWTICSFGGTKFLSYLFCNKKRYTSASSATHSTTATLSEFIAHAFLMDPNSKIVFLPLADLGMIAVFDSLSILLAALSASHTTPILIIILVQLNVPLSVISRFFCVDRLPNSIATTTISQSNLEDEEQISIKRKKWILLRNLGAVLILLSVLFSMIPIYFPMLDPTRIIFHSTSIPYLDSMTMWNTALFAFSCLPAAASQAYKHHALVETAQNVHATFMNFIISITSLIFIILLSPLVYSLQGLGTPITDDMNVTQWIELYPSYTYASNFHQSLDCILGTISDEIQLTGYPEVAHCKNSWLLVLIHVLSIMFMQYALEKMCSSGAPRLVGHSLSFGLVLGSSFMFTYGGYNHPSLIFWGGCILLLILGSEMYQQTSVKIDTFETVYVSPCVDDTAIAET